jgi:rRNA maturation protein Nop10
LNGKKTARQLWDITKRNLTKLEGLKQNSQIYEKLRKCKHIAYIARLRIGHCSLKGYLKRFRIIDDETCPGCGDTKETVKHYLSVCQKYERLRDKLRRAVGVGGMRLEKLLGDSRKIQDPVEFIVEGTERFDF